MNPNNATTLYTRNLIDEYLDSVDATDQNELETDRRLAVIKEQTACIETLDESTSKLTDRQVEITAELASCFGEGQTVRAYRCGKPYAVTHRPGDMFLTVTPLKEISSLAAPAARMFSVSQIVDAAFHAAVTGAFPHPDDDDDTGEFSPVMDDSDELPTANGDVIRLPGRQATIYRGVAVAVADQAAS